MELKNKFDYEVEAFEKASADKCDKRIALYGTGRMTATLLERQNSTKENLEILKAYLKLD